MTFRKRRCVAKHCLSIKDARRCIVAKMGMVISGVEPTQDIDQHIAKRHEGRHIRTI